MQLKLSVPSVTTIDYAAYCPFTTGRDHSISDKPDLQLSQRISAWCGDVYLCVRAQQLVLASVRKLQLMQFLIWNSAPNCWPGKCFKLQITFDQTFQEISLTQIGNKCISLSVIFICSCISATVYIEIGRTLYLEFQKGKLERDCVP